MREREGEERERKGERDSVNGRSSGERAGGEGGIR